jgi:hypothetical protein
MNQRGQYGKNGVNGVLLIGQSPVYVEREHSSTGAWIIGTLAVGGALLWARHQSKQMETIYKTSGMPYQTFTAGLRESARALPSRAKETFRGLTGSARPTSVPTAASAEPAASTEPVDQPAHSVRTRARAR